MTMACTILGTSAASLGNKSGRDNMRFLFYSSHLLNSALYMYVGYCAQTSLSYLLLILQILGIS